MELFSDSLKHCGYTYLIPGVKGPVCTHSVSGRIDYFSFSYRIFEPLSDFLATYFCSEEQIGFLNSIELNNIVHIFSLNFA